MSENTMLYALYRLGYHGRATVHGFRASASTMLNELGFDPDVVERQLAHQERNKVRAAYHRAESSPAGACVRDLSRCGLFTKPLTRESPTSWFASRPRLVRAQQTKLVSIL
jgi:hypothetical protein